MSNENVDRKQIVKDTFAFEVLEPIFLEALNYHKKGEKEFEYLILIDGIKQKILIESVAMEEVIKKYPKSNCKYCYGKGYLTTYIAKVNKKIGADNLIIISEDDKNWMVKQICSCTFKKMFDDSVYTDKYFKYFLKLYIINSEKKES